jgi:hypothetical protein
MQRSDSSGAPASAVATVDIFDCPRVGAVSVGQLHGGDQVWLVGTSESRWGIIRRPGAPAQSAWVPLSMLRTDATAGDLPQIHCDSEATGLVVTTTTTTTTVAATTTVASTPGLPGTTTTSTTTTSTTTVAGDTAAPTVTVTADRDHLYVASDTSPGAPPCSDESALEVTITVADPSLPVAIRSIVANWVTSAGPQTSGLTPVAGNRFSLRVTENGPASGEVPLTLTATAVDGVGNVGTGTLTVSLRSPGSFGCGA